MTTLTNGMTEISIDAKGDINIVCHKQLVLKIGEVSDRETINLFLTLVGEKTVIIETDYKEASWTHELLSPRSEESIKNFIENEPVYQLRKGI